MGISVKRGGTLSLDPNFPNFNGVSINLKRLKFLFLFCPNHSGTTILSQYIASQISGYIPPFGNFEGQMVPSVKTVMRDRPWIKTEGFDWHYIRDQWALLAEGRIFVEASPPNLIRVDEIEPVFGADSTALISICNPYQQISSVVRLGTVSLQPAAEKWVRKAREIMNLRKAYPFFPFISYETFVENPLTVNKLLGISCKEYRLSGKPGSDIEGISSGYHRGIGFLKPDEVIRITNVLKGAEDVMDFFGYALSGPELLDAALNNNRPEFSVGLERRAHWDNLMRSRAS